MSKRLALLFLLAWAGFAQDARRIVEESEHRTRSGSELYEGNLQVIDSKRKISEKSWQYKRIGSYGQSKSVLRFTAPPEVKGVALLVVNHPDRASDQWMWTPAIGRERRIALQDRSTRFFGTDFSFEDLEERDVNQYDYRMEVDETIDGAKCWKIELRPRKKSQYTRSLIWIRQDNYVPVRVENYIEDRLVRRLNYRRIENIQGIWTARELDMEDLRRQSHTILRLDKVRYNVSLSQDDFTVQAMRREE